MEDLRTYIVVCFDDDASKAESTVIRVEDKMEAIFEAKKILLANDWACNAEIISSGRKTIGIAKNKYGIGVYQGNIPIENFH